MLNMLNPQPAYYVAGWGYPSPTPLNRLTPSTIVYIIISVYNLKGGCHEKVNWSFLDSVRNNSTNCISTSMCVGDFDYDGDCDGSDAARFKQIWAKYI